MALFGMCSQRAMGWKTAVEVVFAWWGKVEKWWDHLSQANSIIRIKGAGTSTIDGICGR